MAERDANIKAKEIFAEWAELSCGRRKTHVQAFTDALGEIQNLLSASLYNKVIAFNDEAREYYQPKAGIFPA